jgi:hypothetical protein
MNFLHQLKNKNAYAFGAFLGLISPLILIFVFQLLFRIIPGLTRFSMSPYDNLFLLSLSGNLLLMRIFLVNSRAVKTGKAILLVTFLMVIGFFIFK